jgi:hypothetical protein
MEELPRHVRVRREKAQALARAVHLSELQAAGAARALALHQADEQLDRIARLLPDALGAGVSMAEIARITSVSRPTLYELRARYGESERDLTLAVLQAVGSRGPLPVQDLADHLGRETKEILPVIQSFIGDGLVEWAVDAMPPHREEGPGVDITGKGMEALEAWEFVLDEEEWEERRRADAEDAAL